MPDLESFNRGYMVKQLVLKRSRKRIGNKRMRNPNVYDVPSPNQRPRKPTLKVRKSNPVRRKPTDQVKRSGRKTA
jgi:hypothetical protein